MRNLWTLLLVFSLLLLGGTAQADLIGIPIHASATVPSGTFDNTAGGTNADPYIIAGAGGHDLWGGQENIFQVYDDGLVSGDFEITARATFDISGGGWSRAGLIVRETLDTGSKLFAASIADTGPDDRLTAGMRHDIDAGMHRHGDAFPTNGSGPFWLKISRVGDVFTSEFSIMDTDNVGLVNDWAMIGGGNDGDRTVVMTPDVYVGFQTHGRGNNNTSVSTASFWNLGGALTQSDGDLNSDGSGFWDVAATWAGTVPGGVPTDMSLVTIDNTAAAADVVTVRDMTSVAKRLTIQDASSLTIQAGRLLTIGGAMDVTSTAAIAVDVAGTLVADSMDVAAGSNVTVGNGGSIIATNVNMMGGVLNVVGSGQLSVGTTPSGGSANVEVTGGGTMTVPDTLVLPATDLAGGTFQLLGADGDIPNSLKGARYNGGNNDDLLRNIDDGVDGNGLNGGLFARAPTYTETWTGAIDGNGGGGNNFAYMWTGSFTSPITGSVEFGLGADDHLAMWVDVDQDGEFNFGERVAELFSGCCRDEYGSRDLVAGQTYQIAAAWAEWGGGEWGRMSIDVGSGRWRVNPSDPAQAGFWAAPGKLAFNNTNLDFNVTADSTLEAVSDVSADVGQLTLTNGMITTTGAPITFTGTTIAAGATSVGINPVAATEYGNALDAAGQTLTFSVGSAGAFVEAGPYTAGKTVLAGMTNATINADGGTLTLNGTGAWAGSTRGQVSNGGTLSIRAFGASSPAPPGALAYWGFEDDPASPVAADTAGHPDPLEVYDATLKNTVNFTVMGKIGQGMNFDGGQRSDAPDAAYLDLPDGMDDFTGGVTVAAWVYHDNFTNWRRIIDFGNGAGNATMLLAGRGTSDDLRWENHGGIGPGGNTFDFNDIWATGRWQHVVATIDNDAAHTTKLYFDGVEVASGDNNLPALVTRVNNFIGASNWGGDATFDGLMDEIYIYDRALSAAEAAELYGDGAGLATPVNMFDKHIFVNGSGTVDASGSALTLGSLNIGVGETVTTTGAPITFLATNFDGAGDGTIRIESNTTTILNGNAPLDFGDRNLTIEVAGSEFTGVLPFPATGLAGNTTFDVQGQLATLAMGNTLPGLGDSGVNINGGELLVTANSDQTVSTPLTASGSGLLTLAEIPGFSAGGHTVTFDGGLTLSNNASVGMEALNGYTMNLPGVVTGKGGIRGAQGIVNVTGPGVKDYSGPTATSGGTMTVSAPLPNTSSISVTGGTMVLDMPVTTTGGFIGGALKGSIFYDIPRNESALNLDGAAYSQSPSRVLTGDKPDTILTMQENVHNNVVVTGSTRNWDAFPNFVERNDNADNFVTSFSGRFTALEDGNYNFHYDSDDRNLMYVDANDDGVFDNSERVSTYDWNANGDVPMTKGESHNFIFMAQEYGGGQSVNLYVTPPSGGERRVDPSDPTQAGMWAMPGQSSTTVDAGTLQVNAPLTSGVVTVASGAVLNATAPVTVKQSLEIPGMKITADAGKFSITGADIAAAGPATLTISTAGTVLSITGGPATGGGMPSGLQLHLDASAADTMYTDGNMNTLVGNGDWVGYWKDSSPNGLPVYSPWNDREPRYDASVPELNGKPGLFFSHDGDGNPDALLAQSGSTGITGNDERTLITVWANAENTGQNYQHSFHMGHDGTETAYGHSVNRGDGGGQIGNHYWGDGFNATASGGLRGEANIAISTWDGSLDSFFVNGVAAGTYVPANNGGKLNTLPDQLTIGSRLHPHTEGMRGHIAEVLLFDRVLTEQEIKNVGGYLVDKYFSPTNPDLVAAGLAWDGDISGTPSAPPISLPTTNVVISENATISAVADSIDLADLDVQAGVTSLGLDGAVFLFQNASIADGVTVTGEMAVRGTLNVGNSVGTITIDEGELVFDASAGSTPVYNAEVNLGGNAAAITADKIVVSGSSAIHLDGTLAPKASGRTDSDFFSVSTKLTVVDNSSGGVVTGVAGDTPFEFAAVAPALGDPAPHIGHGAFLTDVIYDRPGGFVTRSVDLDVFVALGGDTDGDKKVWLSDWAALRANFGNTATDKTWIDGNFDPWVDGKVWLSDWASLRANFGNSDYTVAEAGAAAVPEPGTLAMLLGGLVGLALLVRRRRQA